MKMTCCLALFAAVGFTWGPWRPDHLTPREPQSYRGFELLPGDCSVAVRGCTAQEAKEWAPDEVALVKQAIDEILESPGGAVVVNAAHRRGVTALRRFSVGFLGPGVNAFPTAALIRSPSSAHIELYDRFFALGDSRDDLYPGKPGYLFAGQALLHELFHVIDRQSNTPEFLDLAGFVRAGSRVRYAVNTPEEVMALHEWEQQLPLLEAKGAFVELQRLNRRLARQMQTHRIPTLACVRGPAEAFAEIGSHIVLDANAPRYLPKALIQFFRDAVLQPEQAVRSGAPPHQQATPTG